MHIIDLNFLDIDHAIASFLIETSDGPVLIESGPHSTFAVLESALSKIGYTTKDIRHVLLSHIHFDHAGAAWAFAQSGAQIYVHPFGAKHLADPTKLYNSAKMIYGDDMERLWGQMEKIDENQISAVDHQQEIIIGDHTFTALHTPGHARHHIAWQLGKVIFTGDVGGVKIGDGPVVPPCPPPDINLEDWIESIDLIINQKPEKLYLTHFGEINDISFHFDQLRKVLADWSLWIKEKWESGLTNDEITPLFTEYTTNQLLDLGLDRHVIDQYEAANPSWMSVAGLVRYWYKQAQD